MTGRAITPEQKRDVIERIYAAWLQVPNMRLGQLIENSNRRGEVTFYVEDETMAQRCEMFVRETKT